MLDEKQLDWPEYKKYFEGFTENQVMDYAQLAYSGLNKFNPSYLKYDLTMDGSIMFQCNIHNCGVYFEIYFDSDGINVGVLIYKNGEGEGFGGNFDDAIKWLEKIVE